MVLPEIFITLLSIVIIFSTLNWVIWFIRRIRSVYYRPFISDFTSKVSVVIPVYKENTKILVKTVDSILQNNPDEVILILDETEKVNMEMLKDEYGKNKIVKTHFISKPGKRPALAQGIRFSIHPIVVVVDSDTFWVGKDFLKKLIMPFSDIKVGGVGTRQIVSGENKSITQRLIDWFFDIKYSNFVPSDSISGSVLCLSGRTAAYRRSCIINVVDRLENDFFLGHKCMGGDDARLTTLVMEQGYKTVYQDNCVAMTPFSGSFFNFLKQKTRWSRNSFRTYIKSIFSKWPWKQRRFYYIMAAYHTIVPGVTLLFGLFFFVYTIYLKLYFLAFIWFIWVIFSRFIKGFSHLRKNPVDIFILPFVIVYFYLLGFIKIYAFFTMTKESWAGSRNNYVIKNGIRVMTKKN